MPKTRKTLLLNLSAPQFAAPTSSPFPCSYCNDRTFNALHRRGLVNAIGIDGHHTLTPFGAAAVAAYRTAEAAGLLVDAA
jgi:hypothetical protein